MSGQLLGKHSEIVDLRHTIYAHSDDSPFRLIRRPVALEELSLAWPEDFETWVREAGADFEEEMVEQWVAPTRPMLETVRLLAQANREHFADQITEVTERLGVNA